MYPRFILLMLIIPVAVSISCNDSDEIPSERYALRIVGSESCSANDDISLAKVEFKFQLRLDKKSDLWIFHLPTSPNYVAFQPNSGDLSIVLRGEPGHLTGVIGGGGTTDDGGLLRVFFSVPGPQGGASLIAKNALGDRSISGTLNGKIRMASGSHESGECTATDHEWYLTAQ